jgi:N-acetyl-gamma-glutamyl-phosphate reductase
MVKVGVVGATGYTGEEIVNALFRHPEVEITSLTGLVEKEEVFSKLYPRFGKKVSLPCKNLDVDEVASSSELVFLALPHTVSMKIAPEFLKKGKKVIDLSADYRLSPELYEKWYGTKHADAKNLAAAVYGLPELFRDKIKKTGLVANPGCYPTSVILALLPLAKALFKKGIEPIIDSKSGVTGAGRKGHVTLSFGEVDENLKCYKANAHQHMPEMELILSQAAGGNVKVNFTPHLIPIRRGIMSTIYMPAKDLPGIEEMQKSYKDFYKNEPFVRVREKGEFPQILEVAGTNFCDIGMTSAQGLVVIVSVIDNLLKGASGQAVQNMNIMCGFGETTGLL